MKESDVPASIRNVWPLGKLCECADFESVSLCTFDIIILFDCEGFLCFW